MGVDNFSDEGESIRVDSGGRKSENDVSGSNVGHGENEFTLDGSDSESGDIVILYQVDGRQL